MDFAKHFWLKKKLGGWILFLADGLPNGSLFNKNISTTSVANATYTGGSLLSFTMLITWDMWQFRNSVIHGPSGPIAQQQHHELDLQIDEEWALGSADLQRSDKHLFTEKSLEELYGSSVIYKRHWLTDVTQARDQTTDLSQQHIPMVTLRNSLAAWLETN